MLMLQLSLANSNFRKQRRHRSQIHLCSQDTEVKFISDMLALGDFWDCLANRDNIPHSVITEVRSYFSVFFGPTWRLLDDHGIPLRYLANLILLLSWYTMSNLTWLMPYSVYCTYCLCYFIASLHSLVAIVGVGNFG